jgi:hypothetical protein
MVYTVIIRLSKGLNPKGAEMLKQIAYRDGGAIVTDYVEVVFPTTPQPARRRPVVTKQMSPEALLAWRLQALNADLKRTEEERDFLARAERLARATARATESVAGFTPTEEFDDLLV